MALFNHFSHEYYSSLWSQAQSEFRAILTDEKQLGEVGKDIPIATPSSRQEFLEWLTEVYFQYLSVYKKFDEIYDQMVHPQKRPLVRQLLDLTLARLLEYQETMMATELSDYLYYEDIVNIYRYFPEDTDLPVPKYYIYERGPDFERRQRLLDQVLEEKELEKKSQLEIIEADKLQRKRDAIKPWSVDFPDLEPKDLIIVIQTVERQRQATFKFVRILYGVDEIEKGLEREERAKELENADKNGAAVIVQKVVRGFLARCRVIKMRERELVFLGLWAGPLVEADNRFKARAKSKEISALVEGEMSSRRKIQEFHKTNYEKAQNYFESKVRTLEAAEMTENMKSQIRNWLIEVRKIKGKLPDQPKAGDFDSVASAKYLLEAQQAAADHANEEDGNGTSDKKKKAKKGDKETKKHKEKDKKKKKKVKKGLIVTKLEPAPMLEEMVRGNQLYNRNWRLRNELGNEDQKHDESMILDEKRKLVGREVRDHVDSLMKSELNHLRNVLEMRKKKKKKGKKGKKGRRRGKGRKKKKKKKSKDLTPDRTHESLFQELVQEEIIKKVPAISFRGLAGNCSLVNESIRKYYIENPVADHTEGGAGEVPMSTVNDEKMPIGPNPPPTFGDIKRALKDICVLPMGSETVHQIAPSTKSVLLAGPKGSGKKSLVYAICNELGATLFDLSPRNLVGKYEGKHGLIMLFHLLEKVGHWCQPVIVMIEMAEMAYMKRVPKTELSEPKRIKKQLSKFIKMLGAEDRMIVIGLSSEPWAGKLKPMKKDYQRFIYIPKPSHDDRLEMWKQELLHHMTEFNSRMSIDVLAKLTDSWTLGDIKECAERTLEKHYASLKFELAEHQKPFEFNPEAYLEGALTFKPARIGRRRLDMNDFIEELIYIDPMFTEQEKAWNSWFCKTPLQKARLKSQMPPEDEIKKKKKGKKGKDGGKGKKKGISRKKRG